MRLQLFRSLWGCDVNAAWAAAGIGGRLDILKQHRYAGVEASLADIGGCAAERKDFVAE